jgi:flagellar hook-associated protein 3 FlgL
MSVISSVPTGRVSDVLVRERLLGQLQFEQSRLLQLQSQVSTGQRYSLASENPTQALRGIAVRDLIQRKQQSAVNLSTASSYLGATDSALADASSLVNDVKSLALRSIGANATATEKLAAAANVGQQIDRLLQLSNQQFRGRYLFSGAKTSAAGFEKQGGFVVYKGDTNRLSTFSDLVNQLDTNVNGDEAFGALSDDVKGTTDFNPVINDQTPLWSLRGGLGVSVGSIAVSDGLNTSVINIKGAVTVGDVARLIEKYPPGWDQAVPTGRTAQARIGPHGFEISLNGGNLSIGEVGGGKTAGELGLRSTIGVGVGPLIGADVNPTLQRTTPLGDLFGTRARAYLNPLGTNNNLIVEATNNGPAYNGAKVKLIDDRKLQAGAGLSAGNEIAQYLTTPTSAVAVLRLPGSSNDLLLTANLPGEAYNNVKVDIVNGGNIGNTASAVYNPGSKTLTLTIDDDGETQIGTLAAQIDATGVFTATRDTTGGDSVIDNTASVPGTTFGTNIADTANTGSDANTLVVRIASGLSTANNIRDAINATGSFTARLDPSETNNLGTNVVFDTTVDPGAAGVTSGGTGVNFDKSGLQIVNGGQTFTIDVSNAKSVDDLLNAINGAGANVLAEINDAGTGINIRSTLSGTDFAIGENGGSTATQLGIRSETVDTALSKLNYGAGVRNAPGNDLTFTRRDGNTFSIDLSSGTYATATINGTGANDALTISSVAPGVTGNSFNVAITDSGSGGGNSVALVGNTLTFSVDIAAGFSASQARTLLAGTPGLSTQFVARVDTTVDTGNTGAGNLAVTAPVSLSGGKADVSTIGDVLNIINNAPGNVSTGTPLVARLATVGNGLEFVDNSVGIGTLRVAGATTSVTGTDLGLFPAGQTTSATPVTSGGSQILTGRDTNPNEVSGLFTALIRLKDALSKGDDAAIQRSVAILDKAGERITVARGDVGLRSQAIDLYQNQLSEQKLELEKARSNDLEVDLTETISQLTARQASFEAALRAAGTISQLTLLNFL